MGRRISSESRSVEVGRATNPESEMDTTDLFDVYQPKEFPLVVEKHSFPHEDPTAWEGNGQNPERNGWSADVTLTMDPRAEKHEIFYRFQNDFSRLPRGVEWPFNDDLKRAFNAKFGGGRDMREFKTVRPAEVQAEYDRLKALLPRIWRKREELIYQHRLPIEIPRDYLLDVEVIQQTSVEMEDENGSTYRAAQAPLYRYRLVPANKNQPIEIKNGGKTDCPQTENLSKELLEELLACYQEDRPSENPLVEAARQSLISYQTMVEKKYEALGINRLNENDKKIRAEVKNYDTKDAWVDVFFSRADVPIDAYTHNPDDDKKRDERRSDEVVSKEPLRPGRPIDSFDSPSEFVHQEKPTVISKERLSEAVRAEIEAVAGSLQTLMTFMHERYAARYDKQNKGKAFEQQWNSEMEALKSALTKPQEEDMIRRRLENLAERQEKFAMALATLVGDNPQWVEDAQRIIEGIVPHIVEEYLGTEGTLTPQEEQRVLPKIYAFACDLPTSESRQIEALRMRLAQAKKDNIEDEIAEILSERSST